MADDEEPGSPEEAPADVPADTGAPLTGWQRLSQTFLHPPGPKSARPAAAPPPEDLSHLSDDERRRRINQIDATERKVGLGAGALAVVFSLVYTLPYMVSKISVATTTKPVHKACAHHYKYTVNAGAAATCNTVYSPSHYAFQLVVWLIFSAAIFVTVMVGRRALMAFAIVITGLAFGTFILLLPFVAAGGWLLLRAWRVQRYGSPTARAPVEGYVPPPPRGARRPPGAEGNRNATRRRRADQGESIADVRKPPSASKRYTPKTPQKKKPPPPPD